MTGSCYKPSEGFCERVVIGSQARLRIWCLCAYGFESLRSHKNSSRIGCFFCPAKGQRLRIPSPPDSPRARGMLSPISPSVASLLRSHKIAAGEAAFLCREGTESSYPRPSDSTGDLPSEYCSHKQQPAGKRADSGARRSPAGL